MNFTANPEVRHTLKFLGNKSLTYVWIVYQYFLGFPPTLILSEGHTPRSICACVGGVSVTWLEGTIDILGRGPRLLHFLKCVRSVPHEVSHPGLPWLLETALDICVVENLADNWAQTVTVWMKGRWYVVLSGSSPEVVPSWGNACGWQQYFLSCWITSSSTARSACLCCTHSDFQSRWKHLALRSSRVAVC